MPLNATTLRNLIDTTFAGLSASYADAPSRDTIKTGLIQAIASAIVEHLDEELEVGGYTAVAALPQVSSVAGGDLVRVSQSGTERRATLTEVVALAEGATPIADLPAVSSVAGTDLVRVSQGGTERKATLTEVVALAEGGSGPEVITDVDVGGAGTSSTSTTPVDTNIAVALGTGTYTLQATGVYLSSSGGAALRFAGAAAGGLEVSAFALHLLAQVGSAGATLDDGQALGLGAQTNNTSGGTVDCVYTLTGHIVVTTAGTLKLQMASAFNGFNVSMKSCAFVATKVG